MEGCTAIWWWYKRGYTAVLLVVYCKTEGNCAEQTAARQVIALSAAGLAAAPTDSESEFYGVGPGPLGAVKRS